MKIRSTLMIALTILLSVTVMLVFAQDVEPMANPNCAADQLGDLPDRADGYYTDAQTALRDGDVRGWLDNLRQLSWFTASLRASCDNYSFSGDADGQNSLVLGPVNFPVGVYTVTATTAGYFILHLTPLSGNCDELDLHLALSQGDATNGAQTIFQVEDDACVGMLEISNLTESWTLEFSAVVSAALAPTAAATAEATPDADQQDVLLIEGVLFANEFADDINGVVVNDGRDLGAERTAFINFTPRDMSDDAFANEVFTLLDAVATAIDTYQLDLDSVQLVIAVGTHISGRVNAQADDLVSWHNGDMTDAEFRQHLDVTSGS